MTALPDEAARLSALYAGLSDGELQKLADDSASLTEVARIALSTELQRRGGMGLPEGAPADNSADQPELSGVVTLRKFRDLPEALLAKGSLESAGIECYLVDENMVRMDWFISNLLGGVKLQVRPEDIEEATAILDMPIPQDIEVEGSGTYRQPHCPHCGSLDVSFEGLNKPAAYVTAWVGLPIPLHRKAWRCDACGREWEETGADVVNEP
jgi:hypothetical protein